MDFSNYLFRASCCGKLMTEPRSKSETLSETTKTYLRQLHREEKYGRKKVLINKYMEKGTGCEEESITLYTRVKKELFTKNEQLFTNEFICGTPDITDPLIDIKTSWDLFTFPYPSDTINKDYYWQLQCYMELTNENKATLAYCLVNTPELLIMDEERRLFYKMNAGTEENEEYQQACKELRHNMTFDDIPLEEKVVEFEVHRNEADLQKLYARIVRCREYMNSLSS